MGKEYHREEIVYSHSAPFEGQCHRASGNFSTRYIQDSHGKKPMSLLWEIVPEKGDDSDNITFQVYEDVSGGFDKGKFGDKRIRHGVKTKFIDERNIYIYCPEGAKHSFKIKITGMDVGPDNEYK